MAPAALRPITYAALAVVYLAGNGKAYYLASLYPLLLGLGALPTSEWTIRAPKRTSLLGTAIALSAAVSAVIALPLLPERDLQGSIVIALNKDQGETVGWPRFVRTVSTAWQQIPSRRTPAHRDLHQQLRRGRRDHCPRIRTQTPARLQRPQRIQRMGTTTSRRYPSPANRFRQRRRRRALLRPISHARYRQRPRRPRQ
jgi:hypothetical protein